MWSTLLLLSAALAADYRAGWLLPAASHEAGAPLSASVGVGGFVLADPQWLALGELRSLYGGGVVGLSVGVPVGQRVAVGASANGAVGGGLGRAPAAFLGAVNGRITAVDTPHFDVGAFGWFGWASLHDTSLSFGDGRRDPATLSIQGGGLAGASLSGAWSRWSFDAALPLLMVYVGRADDGVRHARAVSFDGVRWIALPIEVRVDLVLGRGNALFGGVQTGLPCVGWRHDQAHWGLQAGLYWVGVPMPGAELTRRW